MTSGRGRALLFGVTVHVIRFGVIIGALAIAVSAGVSGWFLGLVANVACVVYAVVLVTWRRLWRERVARGLAWEGRPPLPPAAGGGSVVLGAAGRIRESAAGVRAVGC